MHLGKFWKCYIARVILSMLILAGSEQVVLQLLFIADVARRRVHLPEHDRSKPGRQVVTFLLICNVTMWVIYTFEAQKVIANPVQVCRWKCTRLNLPQGSQSLWPCCSVVSLSLTSRMLECSIKCITVTTSTLWTLYRRKFILLWLLQAITRTLFDCSWISMGFWPGWLFSGWHCHCVSSTGSTRLWHWQRSGKLATRPVWSSCGSHR